MTDEERKLAEEIAVQQEKKRLLQSWGEVNAANDRHLRERNTAEKTAEQRIKELEAHCANLDFKVKENGQLARDYAGKVLELEAKLREYEQFNASLKQVYEESPTSNTIAQNEQEKKPPLRKIDTGAP